MRSACRSVGVAIAIAAASCSTPPAQRPPVPITAPAERPAAPVVREPMPAPAVPAPSAAAPRAPAADASAFIVSEVPPGTLYVCVSSPAGKRQQLAIAFDAKVEKLCRRHPEMGPCQYERDVCRRAGGRVFTAAGDEITTATEAEYDRKVTRVRFRGD
jgi:hypothetical protein